MLDAPPTPSIPVEQGSPTCWSGRSHTACNCMRFSGWWDATYAAECWGRGYSLGHGAERLGLAGALLGDRTLLILDEPANGLEVS